MADTATRTLAPCGTIAAYSRHRKRHEPIDEACRLARNTYESGWRTGIRADRLAAEARRYARGQNREVRVVRPPGGPIALGALAGTTQAHGHLPDTGAGSMCLACFGWLDDPRHTHRLWLGREAARS